MFVVIYLTLHITNVKLPCWYVRDCTHTHSHTCTHTHHSSSLLRSSLFSSLLSICKWEGWENFRQIHYQILAGWKKGEVLVERAGDGVVRGYGECCAGGGARRKPMALGSRGCHFEEFVSTSSRTRRSRIKRGLIL